MLVQLHPRIGKHLKVTSFLKEAKVGKLNETMAKHGSSRCVRMMNAQPIEREENNKEKKKRKKKKRKKKVN